MSSFQNENFSNWVIGPELGKFIAGMRNDDTSICVNSLKISWKYASKAGVWKDNDKTLNVKCYEPRDEVETQEFGRRRTTTRLPVTFGLNDRTTVSTKEPPVDCEWTDFTDWTPCSASCNTGTQSRSRRVARIARNGGRRCSGSPFESRTCNSQRCPVRTTTTRTTTTTTVSTTTERRRPEPRRDRINCFTCGSLFTTDAPDCGTFNASDSLQRKTCDAGEVCLWYSYLKAANDRATIRECYSPRILLGSIDNPIEPQQNCDPRPVESGDTSVIACLCTDDYCNGFGGNDQTASNRQSPPQRQSVRTTEAPRRQATRTTTAPRRQTQRTTKPPRRTTSPPRRQPQRTQPPRRQQNQPQPTRSDPNRVLCHQCGSFFSGNADDCPEFNSAAQGQRKYCDPGQACLFYSWQKSATETAAIRECFSPTILLGSVDNPLRVKRSCNLQDISETPGASIMACLCDSDLCNANNGENFDEPVAFPLIADPPSAT